MTREEFTSQLPPIAGDALGVSPPLLFRGVSARFFPLRANLDLLQQLCDGYLNFVPPEAGYFRVAAPYVNLVILDYGQMGEREMRSGWFSQNEVYFGMTLEWYKRVGGKFVFHDWAVITPYIFVNDDVSAPVGRTVYGFQKILAQVELTESKWMKNPLAGTMLARIATKVFPEAYTGGNLETRVFLDIEKAALSNARIPFDMTSPMMPWTIASNVASAIAGFGRDAMWAMQALRISPVNPLSNPGILPAMLRRMLPSLSPGGSGFILNSINLKQFRRASDPSRICYQALTNGRMKTTGFIGAGLLGEERLVLGDLSGGHSIRLYEHSSLPIAQVMGLEVNRSWSSDGMTVAEFKPIMPFWMDLDLEFSAGANLAWRSANGIWMDDTGVAFDASQKPGKDEDAPFFNSTVSTAIEAIAGPYEFTGTTVRVMPLLADKKKLQKFVDKSLNEPLRDPVVREDGIGGEHVRFQVWARSAQSINEGVPIAGNFAYVYLTGYSFDGVMSKTDNVGDWAKYELSFLIPVKWQRMSAQEWNLHGENGKWETVGVGLAPAFTFVDNCITAISRFEIQGIAAMTANFVRPEAVWVGEGGQVNPQQVMVRVDAELLPALGVGQKATFQPVIEISHNAPDLGLGSSPGGPWHWAEDLRHELGCKKAAKQQYFRELKVARALALELLGNQTPFAMYTLKQFRDAADPDKACYQSLLRVPRSLREVFDVREIEETWSVRIYDYPSLSIVEELGIEAARLEDPATGIVYTAQGIRPFYINATVYEAEAELLLSRAATPQWTLHPVAFQTILSDEKGSPQITVDGMAETLQDEMDPSKVAEAMYQARQRQEARDAGDVIDKARARAAFDKPGANNGEGQIIDPQMVVESVLSREWGNCDPDARWRTGQQTLLEGFSALPQGGPLKPYAEAELYRQLNNQLARLPGAVAGTIEPDDLLQAPKLESGMEETEENLRGEGAAQRWRDAVSKIFRAELGFTGARIGLEDNVDAVSPIAVLGQQQLLAAYPIINKIRATRTPPLPPLPIPEPGKLWNELWNDSEALFDAMREIQNLFVEGEPSPHHNLNVPALANELRLKELLDTLQTEMPPKDLPPSEKLAIGSAHSAEVGQAVDLARKKCDVQYQALLNKLSRAYQKPDFCLRRDAFAEQDRDRLLPQSLSWDANWYYGSKVTLSPALMLEMSNPPAAPDETQPHPAGSAQAAGS
jgi:hypothetical protein